MPKLFVCLYCSMVCETLPLQLSADFVFGNSGFKEILFFREIYCLTHPWERILYIVLGRKTYPFKAAIGDVLITLLAAGAIIGGW